MGYGTVGFKSPHFHNVLSGTFFAVLACKVSIHFPIDAHNLLCNQSFAIALEIELFTPGEMRGFVRWVVRM